MIRQIAATAVAMVLASPALGDEVISLANGWNPAVQLTGERSEQAPTLDIAGSAWTSADWVLEPAPANRGGDTAFYMRNAWRKTYLTYVFEYRPDDMPSNVLLMPKIDRPSSDHQALLANGQTWTFEPSPTMPGYVRIRPAYSGFGLQYLTITKNLDAKWKSVSLPSANNDNPLHAGSMWLRFTSSHGDQQQCVKNMSGTVFDVDWYKGQDVTIHAENNILVLVPPTKTPELTERKSLGFSSCEGSNQRMVAVVRLVGKRDVSGATTLTLYAVAVSTGITVGTPVGGAAAFYGVGELSKYLQGRPDTVYIGVPGKIKIKGTLYDASVSEDEALKR